MYSYSFFIAHADRIIEEKMCVCDYRGSGFDPSIFTTDDSEDIWSNEWAWSEARVRSLYRKFYRETRTGQLMVLRPDEPELYFYEEGRWESPPAFRLLQGQLTGIRSILRWLLIVLVAFACVLLLKSW